MQEKENGQPEFTKEQVSDDTCRRCGSSQTRISACGDANDGIRRRELLCDECGEHWYEGQLPGCPNYQFLDDENEKANDVENVKEDAATIASIDLKITIRDDDGREVEYVAMGCDVEDILKIISSRNPVSALVEAIDAGAL